MVVLVCLHYPYMAAKDNMLVYTTTRELFFNFPQIRIIRSIYDIIVYPLLNLRSLLYSRALLIAVSTRLFRLARVDCSLVPRLSWNVNCTRAEEPGNEARLTVCVYICLTCQGQWSGNETSISHDCVQPLRHSHCRKYFNFT